jgi:hypothetical protein
MSKAKMLGIALRLVIIGLLAFGAIRWLSSSQPLIHAAAVSVSKLLSFEEKGTPSYA